MKCKNILMCFLMCTLWMPWIYAENSPNLLIDTLLKEAKARHAEGDYKRAAITYKQILDLDTEHQEARVGLAAVLMHAQTEAHFSDESDALKALIEGEALEAAIE